MCFLLIRPLYGGRGAPMRWFVALSERMRPHGVNQLQTDVCMFNKYASPWNLAGFAIAHVGGIRFFGTDRFQKKAIAEIQTFLTGEVGTLTKERPIIFECLLAELTQSRRINLPQHRPLLKSTSKQR